MTTRYYYYYYYYNYNCYAHKHGGAESTRDRRNITSNTYTRILYHIMCVPDASVFPHPFVEFYVWRVQLITRSPRARVRPTHYIIYVVSVRFNEMYTYARTQVYNTCPSINTKRVVDPVHYCNGGTRVVPTARRLVFARRCSLSLSLSPPPKPIPTIPGPSARHSPRELFSGTWTSRAKQKHAMAVKRYGCRANTI